MVREVEVDWVCCALATEQTADGEDVRRKKGDYDGAARKHQQKILWRDEDAMFGNPFLP